VFHGADQSTSCPWRKPCVLGPEIKANKNKSFLCDRKGRWRNKPFPMYEVFTTFKSPLSTNRGKIESNNPIERFPQTCNSSCSLRPLLKVCSAKRVIAPSNFSQALDSIVGCSRVSVTGFANPMVIRRMDLEAMFETMPVRSSVGCSSDFLTSVTSLSFRHFLKEISHGVRSKKSQNDRMECQAGLCLPQFIDMARKSTRVPAQASISSW
jgi:hypothetical protein